LKSKVSNLTLAGMSHEIAE
jgi:hypothetical protein